MQILREIMAVYQSSLLGEDEDQDRASADFERIANIMVDPALQMCVAAAEEKKRVKPKWDQAVFVLNCLTYLQVGVILSFLRYFIDRNFAERLRTILVHCG